MDTNNKFTGTEGSSSKTNNLSIIIVDDMHFSRAVIRQALSEYGYSDIRLASSGQEVLKMMEMRAADVLLADWVMPEMNGLDLTETIRERGQAENWYTSVILFTTKTGPEALGEAFHRGVDDFINKPVKPFELLARVYSAGRVSQLQNRLLLQTNSLHTLQSHQESLITLDLLTGLPNQAEYRKHLKKALEQTTSRGGGFCTILIALENLGTINDQYGHEVGDQALISLTRKLQNLFRPTDFIARYKNGTFAIILQNEFATMHSSNILRRIVRGATRRPFASSSGLLKITLSAGAIVNNRKGPNISTRELENHLVAALLKAKSKGAGSIVVINS